MKLRKALNRTLLLMRQNIQPDTPDEVLVDALTGTRVALVADRTNLASHAAQTAFVTAATLMARMGLTVILVAPDIPLRGPQPPLRLSQIIAGLMELGVDLLPETAFFVGKTDESVDLAIIFGDSSSLVSAKLNVYINADDWSGGIAGEISGPWRANEWPFGALTAGALAAGEAFKCAMRKIRGFANHTRSFDGFFAPTRATSFEVAPVGSPCCSDLGSFDCISGGAVIQSALYVLSRIPGVSGITRVIEPEHGDLTNLNRYPLMRRSRMHLPKAQDIATQNLGNLRIAPAVHRYEGPDDPTIGKLRSTVLVGVDHVPSRWQVQRSNPNWLGIGASAGYQVVVSAHQPGWPCAGCAHPVDEIIEGPIPTISIVSFWSGLLLAASFVRHVAGENIPIDTQFTSFCPLRPDGWVQRSRLRFLDDCPVGQLKPAEQHCQSV